MQNSSLSVHEPRIRGFQRIFAVRSVSLRLFLNANAFNKWLQNLWASMNMHVNSHCELKRKLANEINVMSDTKVKKTISFRLDPTDQSAYQALIEGADLSVSEDIRLLVSQTLEAADKVQMADFNVSFEFRWEPVKPHFPELKGHVKVQVTPPAGMTDEKLHRLVFHIPEFHEKTQGWDYEREPFRIDSAYFHRVTDRKHIHTSSKIQRGVMSFHLLERCWVISVFDYGSNLSNLELEERIRTAVTDHIRNTVVCHEIGHLPESRILSVELHEEMTRLWNEQGGLTNLAKW